MTEENNKNCPETCPYLQSWRLGLISSLSSRSISANSSSSDFGCGFSYEVGNISNNSGKHLSLF